MLRNIAGYVLTSGQRFASCVGADAVRRCPSCCRSDSRTPGIQCRTSFVGSTVHDSNGSCAPIIPIRAHAPMSSLIRCHPLHSNVVFASGPLICDVYTSHAHYPLSLLRKCFITIALSFNRRAYQENIAEGPVKILTFAPT